MTTSTVDGEEPPLKRRLRRMIELRGLEPVAAELGLGRQSLACYLARLPLQQGTVLLIESKLAKLDEPRPDHCPTCASTSPDVRGVVAVEAITRTKASIGVARVVCSHDWHEGGGRALPR